MEKSSSKNTSETPFFCHLCSVSCASALNLQSHFLGIKHRKAEEALRNNKADKNESIEIKVTATLQEQIDACKNSEPALGLEYIYQYQKHGYNTYECKLCECRSGLTHMFMHIVGAKHRINYLSKHHPSLGISGPYIIKGPKKLAKLRDICITVEKEFGRQKINVMEGIESPWSFSTDITGALSKYYTPNNELDQLDFTRDDYFDIDDKLAASEPIVTFLDLKAAHKTNQKKTTSSNRIVQHADEREEFKQNKGTKRKVKDTAEEFTMDTLEKKVHTKKPCESAQDFKNNKDLLNFLEHFRILEEGDAKFVNTVVEMLSIALMRHKRISKENEEKVLQSTSKSDVTYEQDKSKMQDPVSSVVPLHTNQDPERHSNKQLFPFPQANKTGPLGERKKIMITFSSSNKAQESAVKCNQRQETHGPVANYKETEDLNQYEREDTTDNCSQNQKFPASHFCNRKSTSESHPSSSLASALQNTVYSTHQVNRGAHFAQTRFVPSYTAFPPRATPPLLPIARDAIVNKFFESIKNMEVAEVISTLNKITATNPAFKGIHVPSLIHYLTETGKLKAEPNMQQLNQ